MIILFWIGSLTSAISSIAFASIAFYGLSNGQWIVSIIPTILAVVALVASFLLFKR